MRTQFVMVGALVSGLLLSAPALPAPSRAAATKSAKLAPATGPVLPWIEDDYTRGMVEAKARKIPILVESWAPW